MPLSSIPTDVQINRLIQNDECLGWWLLSPEPLLWDRLVIQLQQTNSSFKEIEGPSWAKLTKIGFSDTSPDEEYVDLLLREKMDISYAKIQYPTFEGLLLDQDDILLFEDDFNYPAGLLFQENFGPNALDKYTIIDQGTNQDPSRWELDNGMIRQQSNIYGGSILTPLEAPGTIALTGDANWRNIRINASIRSTDNDGIGMVFRYQDEQNYYRFSMDRERNYRRLIKMVDGHFNVLWEDQFTYNIDQEYLLEFHLFESTILCSIDHVILCSIEDNDLTHGKIGWYSWANIGAHFQALQVHFLASTPLLFQSNFEQQSLEIIDAQNSIDGPSEWIEQGGVLEQRSNIYHPTAGIEILGTFAILDRQEYEDAVFHVKMSSLDNDDIGFQFKVRSIPSTSEEFEYYRFSMNKQHRKRRLVKKVGNTFASLWQDNFEYTSGITYHLCIKTNRDLISGYFNGQLLFEIKDNSINKGGIAVYSRANRGAKFEEVLVLSNEQNIGPWQIIDQGITEAPSIWRTFQGNLCQLSNIYTNQVPECPGTFVVAGQPTWKNYALSVELKSDDNDAIGILFRYQDDQNYYRFSMDNQRSYRRLIRMENGVLTILAEDFEQMPVGRFFKLKIVAINDLLRIYLGQDLIFETTDNTFDGGKIGLYSWANTGAKFASVKVIEPAIEAYTLYRDQFQDDDMSSWQTIDLGTISAPSDWRITDGVLRQTSNIYNNTARQNANKRGTILIDGDLTWQDYIFTSRLQSLDDDELGLVFRYIDDKNHYRFTMDRQGSFRRLTRLTNGFYQILWADDFAYETGVFYDIAIVLKGDLIQVYTNDLLTLSIEDNTHSSGKIGLFCWANSNAFFNQIKVFNIDLLKPNSIFSEDFKDGNELAWEFIDDGDQQAPSDWKIENNSLIQSSNIWGGVIDRSSADKPGTYALSRTIVPIDFRANLILESQDNDAIGIMFRYVDSDNYYRFAMDSQRNYQRLVKKVDGVFSVLWEDLTSGYDTNYRQIITIDCQEKTIIGYLNGIQLFEIEDSAHLGQQIGLYSWGNVGAIFHELTMHTPVWKTLYRFGREPQFADGTHFRIYADNAENAFEENINLEQRYIADFGDAGFIHFRYQRQQLQLVNHLDEIIHKRQFIRPSEFTDIPVSALRKRDGTGLFLFNPAVTPEFMEAIYQLSLTFRRDNTSDDPDSQIWKQTGDQSDEKVELLIPWKSITE